MRIFGYEFIIKKTRTTKDSTSVWKMLYKHEDRLAAIEKQHVQDICKHEAVKIVDICKFTHYTEIYVSCNKCDKLLAYGEDESDAYMATYHKNLSKQYKKECN